MTASSTTAPAILASAATTFRMRYTRDAPSLDRVFQHLTSTQLEDLEADLGLASADAATLLATAVLRRYVHRVLDKRLTFGDVGAALQYHGLEDTIEELKARAGKSREILWRLLMAHPMTEYVPVQCQQCGHRVPDETQPGSTDADVGLREDTPTEAEAPLVRGGWYRGPREAVIFVLDCPTCSATSRWFRSSAASVTLNPNRWGRLCGDQEDARTALAAHLGVPLRTALPLDWDHIWSEFKGDDEVWTIHEGAGDAPAANFALRLDEGIGTWSGVLVVGSTDPLQTGDATEEYLDCRPAGRADASLAGAMPRFSERVRAARVDATGEATQARSVNGHLVYVRAGFSSAQVTAVMRCAVEEHGVRRWWEM